MTKEHLTAIRARLDAGYELSRLDTAFLLDEVERLKAREESLVQQSVAQMGVIGRLQVEVERMAAECDEEFKRGAEAMRESAAQRCEVSPIHGQKTTTAQRYADAVRALPMQEDK